MRVACSVILALILAVLRAPAASVVINEVVVDPQQDWNDSQGGDGVPFSSTPGVGAVTASDEWIELYNNSGITLDMTGWTLEMIDSTPTVLTLNGGGGETVVLSAGSSVTAWLPNGHLVIGNPVGDMANEVHLILRNGEGQLVDEIHIGGPGQPQGNADSPANEALARLPSGWDSGNDLADFVQQAATPGGSNGNRPLRIERLSIADGYYHVFDIVGLIPGTNYTVRHADSLRSPVWRSAAQFQAWDVTTNLALDITVPGTGGFYRLSSP